MQIPPPAWVIVTVCGLAAGGPACASLGGGIDTLRSDQQQLGGPARALAAAPAYTAHEIQVPGGGVVREYAAGGTVFAVTWHGPVRPDLQQLLGQYFPAFQQAVRGARESQHRRGPLVLHQPGLVIETGGHMRDFFGRAYLPDRLPAGVDMQELP